MPTKYYVSIEKQIINEETESFFQALRLCYGTYYVFNMKYPQKCSSTLEFIQRYYLKSHHPDKGTKGNYCSKKRVINLLKNLAESVKCANTFFSFLLFFVITGITRVNRWKQESRIYFL